MNFVQLAVLLLASSAVGQAEDELSLVRLVQLEDQSSFGEPEDPEDGLMLVQKVQSCTHLVRKYFAPNASYTATIDLIDPPQQSIYLINMIGDKFGRWRDKEDHIADTQRFDLTYSMNKVKLTDGITTMEGTIGEDGVVHGEFRLTNERTSLDDNEDFVHSTMGTVVITPDNGHEENF
eukprot:gnl/TRDRNA2_/TRDRNA2_179252_c0_seq1.p1 gnl/TRDRNA2_/TRDRNA2_179252_c0~~gnl/TRDRNA2_/TRDRNA2_179252_c0_seq1.p1  ORF type:complete len:209 (-),score=33.87 gnl/TRDRNA2_/TRDRNA2_179252_c0_seq1:96-629(-)